MQTDRLFTLADFLDTLPPARFDIGAFFAEVPQGEQPGGCGTVACACGWAATIPEFVALGFVPAPFSSGGRTTYSLRFGSLFNWPAIQAFFGLSFDQALWLFDESSYAHAHEGTVSLATPAAVAARLRLAADPDAVAAAVRLINEPHASLAS